MKFKTKKDKKQITIKKLAKKDESKIMQKSEKSPKVEKQAPKVVEKEEQKVVSKQSKKPQFTTRFVKTKLNGGLSYEDLKTGKILNRKFSFALEPNSESLVVRCSVSTQEEKGLFAVYLPETDTLLTARASYPIDIRSDLELCPTDFDLLPTALFRDQDFIDRCLGDIADGLKVLADKNGATKELETYTQEIVDLISQKIEKEKENIALEDERRLQENAVTPELEENVNKNIDKIRNLGREKND